MTAQHRELAAGRWNGFSFVEQMANVGSEVERALGWKERGNTEYSMRAVERCLELLDLTIADAENRGRLRELTRAREALVDFFYADNQFGSSAARWRTYFNAFAFAARANR